MKIIYTSDLHYPITSKRTLEQHAFAISQEKPDALILGGDIGETVRDTHPLDLSYFRKCISMFVEAVKCPVYVVVGNHDLWTGNESIADSWAIWNAFKEVVEKEKAIYLEGNTQYLNGVALIGSYLHYDYSAADTVGPCSGFTSDYWKVNKYKVNNDGVYIIGLDDIVFANSLSSRMNRQIEMADSASDVKGIVIATHVPCMEEQMTRMPYNVGWSSSTPYFGNLACQETIRKASKIRAVFSGHSHCYQKAVIGDNVSVFCCGSDYKMPRYCEVDISL